MELAQFRWVTIPKSDRCVSGASFSSDAAVFEPGARHTFDEAVGKGVANPTAMFLSTASMLDHLG